MANDPERLEAERYRRILETAPDAMIVVGTDGRIVYANAQTEALFGHPREALVGTTLEGLLPPRFRAAHEGHMQRFFARPTHRAMGTGVALFGLRRSGEEFPIEVSLSPVEAEEGLLVSAAIRDITERKRLEAAAQIESERREQELREARALAEAGSEAKSEFLSSMSHELRTPLNAVLGFAQLLQRDRREPLSPRHQARVEQILRGGEHLLRLIDDILDLARIEAGRVSVSAEPVGIPEVCAEIRSTLEPLAARHGIHLTLEPLPAGLPMVTVDRTRFVQILMNFGTNAVKYNREGGTVTLSVASLPNGRVRVAVRDDGIGIPLAEQPKLFQPFHRAGQETGPIEGTGIGLAISKRLASLMDAEIGYVSEPGVGSTFWLDVAATDVPLAQGASSPLFLGESALSLPAAHGQVVLYVEDNPANVAFVRDLLDNFDGIELLVATSAEDGIALARTRQPKLLLMDIHLPGMSGFEALATLRGSPATADIPVIALTAAASEKDRERGMSAGFYRYLTKPVKVDQLLAALEEILAPG